MTEEQKAAVERWHNTNGFETSFPEECVEPLHVLGAGFIELSAEVERLKARVAELEPDARRYRFLRDRPFSKLSIFELDWEDNDLDASIDMEMLP